MRNLVNEIQRLQLVNTGTLVLLTFDDLGVVQGYWGGIGRKNHTDDYIERALCPVIHTLFPL